MRFLHSAVFCSSSPVSGNFSRFFVKRWHYIWKNHAKILHGFLYSFFKNCSHNENTALQLNNSISFFAKVIFIFLEYLCNAPIRLPSVHASQECEFRCGLQVTEKEPSYRLYVSFWKNKRKIWPQQRVTLQNIPTCFFHSKKNAWLPFYNIHYPCALIPIFYLYFQFVTVSNSLYIFNNLHSIYNNNKQTDTRNRLLIRAAGDNTLTSASWAAFTIQKRELEDLMISYENCWDTMSRRGITKYSLIYHYGISSNTLRRMSHGEPITTTTINELCLILHCIPQDILSYEVTEEEKSFLEQRELEVSKKKKN